MKKFSIVILLGLSFILVHTGKLYSQNKVLGWLFDNYYEDRLKLFPLEATKTGDPRYNDRLPMIGSQLYNRQLNDFYDKYLSELSNFNREELDADDRTSFDLLKYILIIEKEGLSWHPEYVPFNQINSFPVMISLPALMGTWGTGNDAQPFDTVKDYENWLKRMHSFSLWADTAIANFNKGLAAGFILPQSAVHQMIIQLEDLGVKDTSKNVFYGPVRNFPVQFTQADKEKFQDEYHKVITGKLNPAYVKLADYLRDEYLPHAPVTLGYYQIPDGNAIYDYFVRYHTTTDKTPEEIYKTGLKEVERLLSEMEKVKNEAGFDGSVEEFCTYLRNDPAFKPYKDGEELLNAFREIQMKIEPNTSRLFSKKPETSLEIRAMEHFRAASMGGAEYQLIKQDEGNQGIFYVPTVNVSVFPVFNMECIFLHEAIPGHHFQISLQSENTGLPRFRKHCEISAFAEGWAMYSETVGRELDVYTDPYQYFGFLVLQINRAVRLVVDVGIHAGKMTREDAIEYTLKHVPVPERVAESFVDRYMVFPGQALSYKIGQMKIEELRDKYQKQLGENFSLKDFHDALMQAGSLPLGILEDYMDEWALGANSN